MNRETFEREKTKNQKAYQALRDKIREEHGGKYIALAGGRLIAATASYDDARAAIQQLQPIPEYYLVFPADSEPAFDLVYDLY